MSDFKKEDEMMINRLASFLLKQGMLTTTHLTRMHKHVFYLETNLGDQLILKRHNDTLRLEQQWRFFDRQSSSVIVPFQRFPNQKQFLSDKTHHWTITPYIRGRQLNYANPDDREASLQAIQRFHHETAGIKLKYPLKREMFYIRWYQRLENFRKTESLFWEYGFQPLYNAIVQTAKTYLRRISAFDWAEWEREARKSGNWIHGDVASHNFIRYAGHVYLIDFDLLSCAPPLHDYIQLGQRFLPHVNWNPERLFAYNMVEAECLKPWLYTLLIPSDVMREWLHYLNGHSSRPIRDYLAEMASEWSRRQSFLKRAQNMLN